MRINVLRASDSHQMPWESSSLTGEFFFRPDTKIPVADEKLRQAEKERAEQPKNVLCRKPRLPGSLGFCGFIRDGNGPLVGEARPGA